MPSRRNQGSPPASATPAAPARSSQRVWIVLAVMFGAGLVLVVLLRQPQSPAPVIATATTTPRTAEEESQFSRLTGRWVRPDGGYLLVIDRIDADGTAVAGYFNPKPIHVARAKASREGDVLRFFLELQDVNYPGSTYTLTYDTAADELRGDYFQPALRQTFDVTFVRPP